MLAMRVLASVAIAFLMAGTPASARAQTVEMTQPQLQTLIALYQQLVLVLEQELQLLQSGSTQASDAKADEEAAPPTPSCPTLTASCPAGYFAQSPGNGPDGCAIQPQCIPVPTPSPAPATGPEIWIAPQGYPLATSTVSNADFMDMFAPDAPWSFAAAHTNVFLLYGGAWIVKIPQAQLNAIIANLNARHIDIALTGEQFFNSVTCDTTPGFGNALAPLISKRIAQAGGKITYLVLDEPFTNAMHIKCHMSASDVMKGIAPAIRTYQQYFPDLEVGEEEAVGNLSDPGWHSDYANFARTYASAFGKPFAFVQIDIPLTNNTTNPHYPNASLLNLNQARAFYEEAQSLKAQGLLGKVGLIINGLPLDPTDAAWMQDARNHLQMWLGKLDWKPDQLIFQSWTPGPSHALPETSSDALTSLIPFYFNYVSGATPPAYDDTIFGTVASVNGAAVSVVEKYDGSEFAVTLPSATTTNGIRAGDQVKLTGHFRGLNVTASRITDLTKH